MKKAEKTFDATKGKILPDLSKENKVAETSAPANGKRKQGERVQITFLNSKGETSKSPTADTIGFQAVAKKTNTSFNFELDKCSPETLRQLAAFGASVHARNAVNTTPADEDESAAENMVGRLSGFLKGEYRSAATGGAGATPLIIEALERALAAKGLSAEDVSAKKAAYLEQWFSGEDEAAAKKAKAEVTEKLSRVREIVVAMEEIRAERAAKRAQAAEGSLDDL